MSFQNKSARTEIISLKKPTVLDKLIGRIPKPKGAVPNFGLPKWKAIPLESKIPMIPGPKGAYNFSRQKLGKKLWISSPDAEFNLNDPCNYEMDLKYEGFHDEYLTQFYKRPINIQRMIKLGFVTENLDVKCSLNDYNMYRKYLNKMHNDSVKKELKKQAELLNEKKVMEFEEEKAKKYMERLRNRRDVGNSKENKERENKMREEIFKAKMRKFKDKMEQFEKTKRQDIRKRLERGKEKMEKSRRFRYMTAKLEREKLVKKLTDWKRKESVRRKMRKIRLNREEEERKQLIQNRWKRKEQLQIQELEREEFLKSCVEQERQMFIQEYNKKIEKERQRIQNLLEKTRKFIKCHSARYISEGRRRTCCKIRKCCQEKGQESNDKLKDLTIQTKISQVSTKNIERKNEGDKGRRKKLKTSMKRMKTKKSEQKPQQNKTILASENNEGVESEEIKTIACTEIIPEDDCKSKCECQRVKFLKRYEIPNLLV